MPIHNNNFLGPSCARRHRHRILQHQDDRVSAQKHLGNEPVLVDRLGLLLALARLGHLCPHLLDLLQHHVAVPVEGLHPAQQLLVVAAVDEDLKMGGKEIRYLLQIFLKYSMQQSVSGIRNFFY